MCGRVFDIPTFGALGPLSGTGPMPVDLATAVAEQPLSPPAHESAVTDKPPALEPLPTLPGVAERQFVFVRPGHSLFSTGQIGLAAFLGGSLAGCLLIARNYSKLGQRGAAWLSFLVGLLVTAVVIGSGFLLPEFPACGNLVVAGIFWLAVYGAGRVLQGPAFQLYLRQGGTRATSWSVVGYTVLGAALYLGPALGVAYLYDEYFHEEPLAERPLWISPVEKVRFPRDVSRLEAIKAGGALQGPGNFFDGVAEKSVRLRKDQGEYVLSFFMDVGQDDPLTQQKFRSYALKVSGALDGKPVRVELCDLLMRPKATLSAVRHGKDE